MNSQILLLGNAVCFHREQYNEKRSPTTSYTNFHSAPKTGSTEILAVGKWVCGYRAGGEGKVGIHRGIIPCKSALIQHSAPTKRGMLQNMFSCTETGPPSSYNVHMSLVRILPYFKEISISKQRRHPHTPSVQHQACPWPCSIIC